MNERIFLIFSFERNQRNVSKVQNKEKAVVTCGEEPGPGRVVAMRVDGVWILVTVEEVVVSIVVEEPAHSRLQLDRRAAEQLQILVCPNVVKVDRALA